MRSAWAPPGTEATTAGSSGSATGASATTGSDCSARRRRAMPRMTAAATITPTRARSTTKATWRAARSGVRASSGYNDEFLRWGGAKGGVRGFCEDQVSTVENREEMELLMRSNDIEEFSRRRGADPQARRARISACVDDFDPEKYRRINGIERVAGAGEFLQGRMLKA